MSDLARQLRQLADQISAGNWGSRAEALSVIQAAARRLEQLETGDPLARWEGWDGQTPLGADLDERPGYHGEIATHQRVIALNTGWVTSTRLTSGAPGVYLKLGVRAAGEDQHHVLDLVSHADVGRELGVGLFGAAERAPLDDAADKLWRDL